MFGKIEKFQRLQRNVSKSSNDASSVANAIEVSVLRNGEAKQHGNKAETAKGLKVKTYVLTKRPEILWVQFNCSTSRRDSLKLVDLLLEI